jgi:hypothetical protein
MRITSSRYAIQFIEGIQYASPASTAAFKRRKMVFLQRFRLHLRYL